MSPPGARPAFYALRSGGWRDLVTLLHPPYTALHLSFVVLGAALAPAVRIDRLAGSLLAFFLAVGIASHFLDELNGRPLGTRLPARTLVLGAACALGGACLIGVAGMAMISPLLGLFVIGGALAVLAYNLELWGGAFHGDRSFAVSWGAFPFVTTYFAMDGTLDAVALAGAAGCYAVARLQRSLSTPARRLRRKAASVAGEIRFDDGREPITRDTLLAAPEQALGWLCAAVPLLALAALAARLAR